jgi:hypothetical protein
VSLRRYRNEGPCPLMPGEHSYHNASVLIGTQPAVRDAKGYLHADGNLSDYPQEHPAWPTTCGCGEPFTETDKWQVQRQGLYRRSDTGEVTTLQEAPAGAMWNAWWLPSGYAGPDGQRLVVKCPGGGEWQIDGVANNCTIHPASGPRTVLPYDPDPASDPNAHRCWIRHGEPPNITVDKAGHTCGAGGGSIQTCNYHGFLTGGVFVP